MFKWFGLVNLSPATRVAAFAAWLRDGHLMASRCRVCGRHSFPPRADCERCLSPEFDLVEISGHGTLVTWTRIVAAPSGFEAYAPYTLGVIELEGGGRAMAWLGSSLREADVRVGMALRLVPRLHDELEEIHVDYTLEALPTIVQRPLEPLRAEARASESSPTP